MKVPFVLIGLLWIKCCDNHSNKRINTRCIKFTSACHKKKSRKKHVTSRNRLLSNTTFLYCVYNSKFSWLSLTLYFKVFPWGYQSTLTLALTSSSPFPPLVSPSLTLTGFFPIACLLSCWYLSSIVSAAIPLPSVPVIRETAPAAPPEKQTNKNIWKIKRLHLPRGHSTKEVS